jgi:cytochrome c-type biogenesis protein
VSDPIEVAATAVAGGAASAPALLVLAGLVSGIGPCAGVRGAALMSLISGESGGRRAAVGAFVLGVMSAYSLLALAAPLFAELSRESTILYVVLGFGLVASGIRSLWGQRHRCGASPKPGRRSVGAAFATGFASSAILSPCCTPLILCILTFQAQAGHPQTAAFLLAAFALGHAIPVVATTLLAAVPLRRFFTWAQGDSVAIVSGALQIGVGVFYAVLA